MTTCGTRNGGAVGSRFGECRSSTLEQIESRSWTRGSELKSRTASALAADFDPTNCSVGAIYHNQEDW